MTLHLYFKEIHEIVYEKILKINYKKMVGVQRAYSIDNNIEVKVSFLQYCG